jgi:hypothetical protein
VEYEFDFHYGTVGKNRFPSHDHVILGVILSNRRKLSILPVELYLNQRIDVESGEKSGYA